MAGKFNKAIEVNRNELKEAVLENRSSPPDDPKRGQFYADISSGTATPTYWNGSVLVRIDNLVSTFKRITTNATPVNMTTDGGAPITSGMDTNVFVIPYNSAYRIRLEVVSRRTDVTGAYAAWTITLSVGRDSTGNARIFGTPTVWTDVYGAATYFLLDLGINTSDSVNNYLALTVTGEVAKTISWAATITYIGAF